MDGWMDGLKDLDDRRGWLRMDGREEGETARLNRRKWYSTTVYYLSLGSKY